MIVRCIIVLVLFITTITVYGQVDNSLSERIDSLTAIDQKWRELMRELNNNATDTINPNHVIAKIRERDSLNYIIIKELFDKQGYLGYDKVGRESSHNFWLLVQHADKHPYFQESVLIQMKVETENGNASLIDYAYLLDRVKVNQGKMQVYGTQMKLNTTGKTYEPKPVIDPEKLNDRRKLVGLPTIEEYIDTMNKLYLNQIK